MLLFIWGYMHKPAPPPSPVFLPGDVVTWDNGVRSVLLTFHADLNVWGIQDVSDTTLTMYEVSAEHLEKTATRTRIQPGQMYQAKNYQYKVLRPLLKYRWVCEVLNGPGREYKISEFDILDWTLIEGLDVAAKAHGPHVCPRCGKGGAQIIFKVVECPNSACPCYVPLP